MKNRSSAAAGQPPAGSRGQFGIRTADGRIVLLLDVALQERNRLLFTTIADRQSRAIFELYFRESEAASWKHLDSITMDRIPPARAGVPDLSIEARLDSGGSLRLQARGSTGGRAVSRLLKTGLIGTWRVPRPPAPVAAGAVPPPAAAEAAAPHTPAPAPKAAAPSTAKATPTPAATPTTPPPAAPTALAFRSSAGTLPESQRARPSGKKKTRGWLLAVLAAVLLLLLPLYVLLGPAPWPGTLARAKTGARTGPAGERTDKTSMPRIPATQKQPTQAAPAGAAPAARQAPVTATPAPAAVAPSAVFTPAQPEPDARSAQPAPPSPEDSARTPAAPGSNGAPIRAESDRYKIVRGDTLWRITERFYGDRTLYPELAESNALADPDLIIAGESLVLPPRLGKQGQDRPLEKSAGRPGE